MTRQGFDTRRDGMRQVRAITGWTAAAGVLATGAIAVGISGAATAAGATTTSPTTSPSNGNGSGGDGSQDPASGGYVDPGQDSGQPGGGFAPAQPPGDGSGGSGGLGGLFGGGHASSGGS